MATKQEITQKLQKIHSLLKEAKLPKILLSDLGYDLDDVIERIEEHLQDSLQQTINTQSKQPVTQPKAAPISSDDVIHIWSDGACSGNPGPGGWGTVVFNDGQYQEYSGGAVKTTNNIMEMTGALEGIRTTAPGSKIVITTDSQYLLNGITKWIHGWKRKGWKKADGKPVLNKELWIALDEETRKRSVEWKWIKGHAGHEHNERCDELARNAIP